MATKGESARTKFADMYQDDETAEVGDPEAGDDTTDEGYSLDECIADFEAALSKLKAKAGKK